MFKVIFNDGSEQPIPDAWQAAKAIHTSQKLGNKVGYRIKIDESLSQFEQKRQFNILEKYLDHLRIKDR